MRETERKQEAMVFAIDKKVQMLTDAFSETIGQDKGHVTALELDRLDKERKEILQRQAQARIEANDLETKSISKAAARQTLTAFTEVYGTLSPFDKKALMAQLIHSIIFTKEKVTIRYYVLSDMDILINEKAPQPRGPVSQRLLLGGGGGS